MPDVLEARYRSAIEKLENSSLKYLQFVEGDPTKEIQTMNGLVPSLARIAALANEFILNEVTSTNAFKGDPGDPGNSIHFVDGGWVLNYPFELLNITTHGTVTYLAKTSHSSTVLTEPGVGSNWEDKWSVLIDVAESVSSNADAADQSRVLSEAALLTMQNLILTQLNNLNIYTASTSNDASAARTEREQAEIALAGSLVALASATAIVHGDLIDSNKLDQIIPEQIASFNYETLSKVIITASSSWRTRCKHAFWCDENKPKVLVGQFTDTKGQYANAVLASAEDGAALGMFYYNTTNKRDEVLTNIGQGAEASIQIFAAGKSAFPSSAVIFRPGSDLIIRDLTVECAPLWAHIKTDFTIYRWAMTSGVLLLATTEGVIGINFPEEKLFRYSVDGYAEQPFENWLDIENADFEIIDSTRATPYTKVTRVVAVIPKNARLNPVSGEPQFLIYTSSPSYSAVISAEGTVSSSSSSWNHGAIAILGDSVFFKRGGSTSDVIAVRAIGSTLGSADYFFQRTTYPSLSDDKVNSVYTNDNTLIITNDDGFDEIIVNHSDPVSSLIKRVNSQANTGYFVHTSNTSVLLCDTSTESVSDANIMSVDFTTDWSTADGFTEPAPGVLKVLGTATSVGTSKQSYKVITDLLPLSFHKITFTITGEQSAYNEIYMSISSANILALNVDGDYEYIVQATSAGTLNVGFKLTTTHEEGDTCTINNLRVVELVADKSGNENHFEVLRPFSKELVPGSEIAAAVNATNIDSGWCISRDISFTPGADSLVVSGFFEIGHEYTPIFRLERDDAESFHLRSEDNNKVGYRSSTGVGDANHTIGSRVIVDTGYTHILITIETDRILRCWVDGVFDGQKDLSATIGTTEFTKFFGVDDQATGGNRSIKTAMLQLNDVVMSEAQRIEAYRIGRLIMSGNSVIPAEPVTTAIDNTSGQLLIASGDDIYPYSQGARQAAIASSVGVISGVATGEHGELVQAGSTGVSINIPARNLRENRIDQTQDDPFWLYDEQLSLENGVYWLNPSLQILSVTINGIPNCRPDTSTQAFKFLKVSDGFREGISPNLVVSSIAVEVRRAR